MMYKLYRKTLITLFLLISCFLSSCAFLKVSELNKEKIKTPFELNERSQIFETAEEHFKNKNYKLAKPLYLRLSRYKERSNDPIYDQALWHLAKIYETENEIEKALLTLDEMILLSSNTISKNKIKFTQIKFHFLLTNYNQAKQIKKEIDDSYKSGNVKLNELFEYINETTAAINEQYLLEELLFLGEIQKYFIFIMESHLNMESKLLLERLIKNYDYYFFILQKNSISNDFKKKLSISIYDQLNKFNQYKIDFNQNDSSSTDNSSMLDFYNYSLAKQKILIESFYK